MKDDSYFLGKAIEIGNKIAVPYNFGAVIVKDGEIISSEYNHVSEESDPSLHSEVCAIKTACNKLGSHHLEGCTLYASHEPCLMCFSCAAWAHIDRIVFDIPASNQPGFNYEINGLSIIQLSKKLHRPMLVEHIAQKRA